MREVFTVCFVETVRRIEKIRRFTHFIIQDKTLTNKHGEEYASAPPYHTQSLFY